MLEKQKMQTAKQLIQQKRYSEARRLLVTVDNPIATKWLMQLDKVAPESKVAPSVQPAKKPRYTWRRTLVLVLMIPVGLVVVAGGFLVIDKAINGESRDASSRMFGFCLEVYREVGGRSGVGECLEWRNWRFEVDKEKVVACHRQSPVLDDPFNDCLIDEEIIPTGFTLK